MAEKTPNDAEHWLVVTDELASEVQTDTVRIEHQFPKLEGLPTLGRLQRIANAMRAFDLVCTYEYATMNAVMARTAFSRAYQLPPVIHHELELSGQSRKNAWFRKIALAKAAAIVVPNRKIESRALSNWEQPDRKVQLIPDGIELSDWRKVPKPDLLPNLLKRPGEKWVGAFFDGVQGDRFRQVLGAFQQLTENWQLVLLGEGEWRREVRATAEELNIAHRVHTPGKGDDQERVIGLFDIALVLSGVAEKSITTVRYLASGIPVIADRGSVAATLLPDQSKELIVPFDDADELSIALATLAADENLCRSIGEANLQQANSNHSKSEMTAAYLRLFRSVNRSRPTV